MGNEVGTQANPNGSEPDAATKNAIQANTNWRNANNANVVNNTDWRNANNANVVNNTNWRNANNSNVVNNTNWRNANAANVTNNTSFRNQNSQIKRNVDENSKFRQQSNMYISRSDNNVGNYCYVSKHSNLKEEGVACFKKVPKFMSRGHQGEKNWTHFTGKRAYSYFSECYHVFDNKNRDGNLHQTLHICVRDGQNGLQRAQNVQYALNKDYHQMQDSKK